MKGADFFEKKEQTRVKCYLCPHECLISAGKSGICGARKNIGGELYSLNYGFITGMSYDPIEKKPLYHYYPGSQILSIGTAGCNLHCPFCQNYQLSRYFDDNKDAAPEEQYSPEAMLAMLVSKSAFGGIAYTYSEPNVWLEYVYDTALLLSKHGYKNVMVSNGYINPEPLAKVMPYLDAANIDLKAFTEEGYRKLGGKLAPVLRTINQYKEAGKHIELTTLVVTGLNDTIEELEKLVKWVASVDKKIPLHLSRYFPQYQYQKPSTSLDFLDEAYKMAAAHLDYVYLGNTHGGSDTKCPSCGNILIARMGYQTTITGITGNRCSKCRRNADIILPGE
jgi:pyruvate formate lyase activating enzyme